MKSPNISRPQTGQQLLGELEQQLKQRLEQGYADWMEDGSRKDEEDCLYENVMKCLVYLAEIVIISPDGATL